MKYIIALALLSALLLSGCSTSRLMKNCEKLNGSQKIFECEEI